MEKITIREITEAIGGKLLCGDPNVVISHVSIDSRDVQPETIFTPIIGERVDAHKFIPDVIEKGIAAVFTSRGDIIDEKVPHVLVDDTQKAIGRLSTWYKKKFPIPVVGVTGSVGKTSTKEMIAQALSTKYNVLKTAGNQNSEIGVPLTLFNIESQHEIAVIEMGISDFGEMDTLVSFVHPETAVVTNIGVAHIANLHTQENIMKEKLCIASEFGTEGNLYLNGDDALLNKELKNITCKGHLYGVESGLPFDAQDCCIKDGFQCFTFCGNGVKIPVKLRQIGIHNVHNAVVAIAIAMQYGVDPVAAAEKLSEYTGVAMRQQISHLRDGILVIDDTYNASPDSIKSGIDVLKVLDNKGRKIAVLGDVLELGEMSEKLHYETGLYVADKKIDEVVAIGNEMKALAKAVKEHDHNAVVNHFDNNETAGAYLLNVVKAGDAILVKGSRGMHEEEIVALIKENFM